MLSSYILVLVLLTNWRNETRGIVLGLCRGTERQNVPLPWIEGESTLDIR